MHMLEGAGDLPHVVPDSGFIELQFLALFILDELFEVAPLSPFGDDDQLVVVDEGVDELDDVRVA
jgi:hypothetical protein